MSDGLLTVVHGIYIDHDLHGLWGENTSDLVLAACSTRPFLCVYFESSKIKAKNDLRVQARNNNTPAYVTSHPERQTAEDSVITGALDTARASLLLAAVPTLI